MNAADYGNKLTEYTNQLYEKLSATMPTVQYNPTSTAQLRDNLETAYRAGYDQSVDARREATRRNNAAIDADAAARGMGASTWVTDAKMRQADSEAADLASLAAQRDSAIAQQLASALSSQEANRLAVEQFNASQKANALSQALSGAQNMIALDQQKSRSTRSAGVRNDAGTQSEEDVAGYLGYLNSLNNQQDERQEQGKGQIPLYDPLAVLRNTLLGNRGLRSKDTSSRNTAAAGKASQTGGFDEKALAGALRSPFQSTK